MSDTKQCIECSRVLALTEFWVHKRSADGRFHRCKTCAIPRTGPNATVTDAENQGVKFCPQCKQVLPKFKFHKNKRVSDGLQSRCADCQYEPDGNETERCCHRCKKTFPLSNFHRCRTGYQHCCKPCNLHQARAAKFRKRFGITIEQYDAMVAAQQGLCAICGKPEKRLANNRSGDFSRLCVDHDHRFEATPEKSVRGLLCYNCNAAIGLFFDSPELLQNAIDYILKHRSRLTEGTLPD